MRTPILMEEREERTQWPGKEIEQVQQELFKYLQDYYKKDASYAKHSIMGPVGKLLPAIAAAQFGDNVEAYVGFIDNIHGTQSEKPLSVEGRESLRRAVQTLVELKKRVSERTFLKIVRTVDYGVYYLKVKQIAERAAQKKDASQQTQAANASAQKSGEDE